MLSYHTSNHLIDRPPHYGSQEHKEALYAQAVLASYAWTYGQACYQGIYDFSFLLIAYF